MDDKLRRARESRAAAKAAGPAPRFPRLLLLRFYQFYQRVFLGLHRPMLAMRPMLAAGGGHCVGEAKAPALTVAAEAGLAFDWLASSSGEPARSSKRFTRVSWCYPVLRCMASGVRLTVGRSPWAIGQFLKNRPQTANWTAFYLRRCSSSSSRCGRRTAAGRAKPWLPTRRTAHLRRSRTLHASGLSSAYSCSSCLDRT